jgi:hypothetical protein
LFLAARQASTEASLTNAAGAAKGSLQKLREKLGKRKPDNAVHHLDGDSKAPNRLQEDVAAGKAAASPMLPAEQSAAAAQAIKPRKNLVARVMSKTCKVLKKLGTPKCCKCPCADGN